MLIRKKKRLAIEGVLGSLTSSLIAIASVVVVARLLGPVESGLAITALTILSTVQLFSDIGLAAAIVQRQRIRTDHLSTAFGIALLLAGSATSLAIILSPFVANFFNEDRLGSIITIGACGFMLRGYSSVFEAYLQRMCKFRYLAYAEVIGAALGSFGVTAVLAYNDFGAVAPIFGLLAQLTLRALVMRLFSKITVRPLIDFRSFSHLAQYGGLFSVARLLNHVATQADTLIVSKFLGVGPAGLYGRAFQVLVAPANLIGQVISNVAFPMLSKIQQDRLSVLTIHVRILLFLWAAACPISGYLYYNSDAFVRLLFGNQWLAMSPIVAVLSLILPFRIAYKSFDPVYKALSLMRQRVYLQAAYAFLVVSSSIAAFPHGVVAVAGVVSSAVVIHFLFSFFLLRAVDRANSLKSCITPMLYNALLAYCLQLLPFLFEADLESKIFVSLGLLVLNYVVVFRFRTLFLLVPSVRRKD